VDSCSASRSGPCWRGENRLVGGFDDLWISFPALLRKLSNVGGTFYAVTLLTMTMPLRLRETH
jgi:hypothetical protein